VSTVLIALAGGVALLVLLFLAVVSRYKVGGPNEAFIVTGRKGRPVKNPETGEISTDMSGQRVVMGASIFVLPFVQRLQVMDLSSRRIPVGISGAVSAQGIKCDLEGVAIVKVGGNEDAIRAAAQRFLNQQEGITQFTQEVLAGSLRAIVGRLTVDEIIKDRAAFAAAVAEEAETSLTNQGLALDTFQLQDIQAEGDYLTDLGRPESARVQKEAAIAEARARQAAEQEQLLAQEAIAVSQRQLRLKQAEIQAEMDAAKARAAAAGPLAQAARDQEVLVEQEKVAERAAAVKDRELDTQVRKPADAARYRVEQEAQAARNASIFESEAERARVIAEAEATAAQNRLAGEGERARRAAVAQAQQVEGEAERARRSALAEAEEIEGQRRGAAERARREAIAIAVQREGEAEAAAILARGEAEATARRRNAEAFREYGDAAVLELLTQVLPQVVRAAAEPLAAVDKLTILSADGAAALPRSVAGTVAQGLQLGSDLTGVDLQDLFRRLAGPAGRDGAGPDAGARAGNGHTVDATSGGGTAPGPGAAG